MTQVIAFLDDEFVFSKGREISLAQRFPGVLHERNLQNIFVACADSSIVSVIAAKHFKWITPEAVLAGVMIGMVYTRPEYRGRGLASRVMLAAQDALRESEADFAVLWATRPEFYRRLGWIAGDCGCYATVAGQALPDQVTRLSAPEQADLDRISRLHSKWAAQRVARDSGWYAAVPPPAREVKFFTQGNAQEGEAYAIVGKAGDTGYLYELTGDPSCFDVIWRAIKAGYRHIYINDRIGSASYAWFSQTGEVKWSKQSLAMWLPLRKPEITGLLQDWHISYFDRI